MKYYYRYQRVKKKSNKGQYHYNNKQYMKCFTILTNRRSDYIKRKSLKSYIEDIRTQKYLKNTINILCKYCISRQYDRIQNVKSIWFWKVFRELKVLRQWKFMATQRFNRRKLKQSVIGEYELSIRRNACRMWISHATSMSRDILPVLRSKRSKCYLNSKQLAEKYGKRWLQIYRERCVVRTDHARTSKEIDIICAIQPLAFSKPRQFNTDIEKIFLWKPDKHPVNDKIEESVHIPYYRADLPKTEPDFSEKKSTTDIDPATLSILTSRIAEVESTFLTLRNSNAGDSKAHNQIRRHMCAQELRRLAEDIEYIMHTSSSNSN